jgi:hypothetical protein
VEVLGAVLVPAVWFGSRGSLGRSPLVREMSLSGLPAPSASARAALANAGEIALTRGFSFNPEISASFEGRK